MVVVVVLICFDGGFAFTWHLRVKVHKETTLSMESTPQEHEVYISRWATKSALQGPQNTELRIKIHIARRKVVLEEGGGFRGQDLILKCPEDMAR